jgi:hypothetical protein
LTRKPPCLTLMAKATFAAQARDPAWVLVNPERAAKRRLQ